MLFISSTTLGDSGLAVPINGEPFRADIAAVAATWQITFGPQEKRTIAAGDLVRWGRCAEQGRGGTLVLADGSLIAGELFAADQERVTIDSDVFGRVKIPVEAMAGVVFRPPTDPQRRDMLVDNIVKPALAGKGQGVRAAATSDCIILLNGDELTGLLTGIADETVRLRTHAEPIEIKTDRITAISFNPSLRISNTKPRSLAAPGDETAAATADRGLMRAWAGLGDGSRLLATRLIIDDDRMTITAAGQSFVASRRDLVFLQPLGGRVVYLSDLKPIEYQQTPFVALAWPYRTDRNVTGSHLRAGGRLYLKGLGVHSAARLVYKVSPRPLGKSAPVTAAEIQSSAGPLVGQGPGVRAAPASPRPLGEGQGVRALGAARRFDALVAIDDSTAGGGSVRFRVLVDGREKFTSPIVRGGDPPVPVSVDITGAKRLELVVDYADSADVLDHADWLDARITL
ncbi:MAG: NPCBM/NEW2 domain-containing protein [Planctomycetaceae bacterium]|nr:NPCBM/NEW2 domain-containing protein [Planctomycetaceae bacterium]